MIENIVMRPTSLFSFGIPKEMALREYQQQIKDEVNVAKKQGIKAVVAQAPTGAGKTHIAASIVYDADQLGMKCAFICDRIELINQTSARFDDWGIEHGVIQAQHERTRPHERIQVASIQTVNRRGLNKVDICLIDECHGLHKAHIKLMEANPDTFFIGLSATPYSKGLGKYFQKLVNPVSVRQLIDGGHLVDYRCFVPGTIDLSDVRTVAGEYDQGQLAEKVKNPKLVGEIIETWMKYGEGRQTICFATNIAHSKWIVQEFEKVGIKAAHVDCFTDADERKEILAKLASGDLTIVSCVDILTKGFDCPPVSCIIQALPTKSLIRHIQQIGRGLRTFDGKKDCLILDHAKNYKLGCIDEIEAQELDDGKKNSSSVAKKKEKIEKVHKICPSCSFLKPAGVRQCPACGLIPQVVIKAQCADGELVELKKKAKQEVSHEDKQAFLAGLNSYAKAKNFNPGKNGCYGWSIHKYIEKFNIKPASNMRWNAIGPITPEVERFIKYSNIKYNNAKRKEYLQQA